MPRRWRGFDQPRIHRYRGALGTARGPDPKDMAPQVRMLNETLSRAMDDLGAGRPDEALAGLKMLPSTSGVRHPPPHGR